MISTVHRVNDRFRAVTSQILLTTTLSAFLLTGGCKKAPEAASAPSETAPSDQGAPVPAPSPRAPSKPSAVVEVPSPTAQPASPRIMYVKTAFEAVSDVGTHQFPLNARVSVVGEEGDDYIVEYKGVSVRNNKSFFSGAMVEEIAPLQPGSAAANPDAALLGEAPSPTPDPAAAANDKKSAELIDEIRTVNDEIRVAEEKLPSDASPDQKAAVDKLKKRRDKLSEDLTAIAKP